MCVCVRTVASDLETPAPSPLGVQPTLLDVQPTIGLALPAADPAPPATLGGPAEYGVGLE